MSLNTGDELTLAMIAPSVIAKFSFRAPDGRLRERRYFLAYFVRVLRATLAREELEMVMGSNLAIERQENSSASWALVVLVWRQSRLGQASSGQILLVMECR